MCKFVGKVSRVVEDNWYVIATPWFLFGYVFVVYVSCSYDGQEMLMRPGSSTGTVSLSTSNSPPPRSPLDSSAITSRETVPFYSQVHSTAESSGNGTTTSTTMYSETSNLMVGYHTIICITSSGSEFVSCRNIVYVSTASLCI